MAKASELIRVARTWIGKNGKDGSHREIIDIYNGHKPLARGYAVKYTDHWCATYITALAIVCDALDIIPKECGCGQMIELFKKIGCWVENDAHTPKMGDIIFYDWDDSGKGDNTGWSDHVGIVEKVVGDDITVIEGNYNNAVKRRTLKVNGKYIRGYGVPKYEDETIVETVDKSVDEWAKEIILGKHGSGHENREASLKKAGCTHDYQVVRARVNELCNATITPQYYAQYTGDSYRINDVFKAIGVPSQYIGTWDKRIPIAKANAIKNYTGTYGQNTSLIDLAKRGLLKKV